MLYVKSKCKYNGYFKDGVFVTGTITFENGIEAVIKNYECVNIDRTNVNADMKHKNAYAINMKNLVDQTDFLK